MMRIKLKSALAAGAAVLSLALAAPASAQLAVIDPTNLAQNVIQAANSLEQINNQIRSLQNEATSLINEARNLASLPLSTLQTLQGQVQRTQQLLAEAQRIAYDVAAIDRTFMERYRAIDPNASDQNLVADARERWRDSVAAFEDTMRVQAGVVRNIEPMRGAMEQLTGASQSATGALQAAQAGNQLLALQAQQLADLTAMLAAQSRADTLESARAAADQAMAREQLRRFLRRPHGYQPGDARMFHN